MTQSRTAPIAGTALAGLALLATPAFAASITFSAAGSTIASISPTVDAFRNSLGANNGNAVGTTGGRREINWDGGGTATTSTPGALSTFQNNRGALFTTPGTGFLQAPDTGLDAFFGRVDSFYQNSFEAFSPLRLFAPVGSTITDVTFFVPGSNGATPATVNAFGAIFSDVDTANVSSLQFFAPSGASLGTFFVPAIAGSETFSFLGVRFDAGELVGSVRITSGNIALSGTAVINDQVAMDDFIFSEPQVVPEPSSFALFAIGVAVAGVWRLMRSRARQAH